MENEDDEVSDMLMEFFKLNNINAIRGCSGMIHLMIQQMYHGEKKPGKKKFMEFMSEAWDVYDEMQKSKK